MHHPPVLMHSVWMDRIGLQGRELLVEYLNTEPRIRLICCGHVHHESTSQAGFATVVTTPSTGVQFTPKGDVASFEKAPPGFRIIDLDDAGFTTRVLRLPEAVYTPE
jgi:Icc protein